MKKIKDYNIEKPDEFPINGERLMNKLEEIIIYFNLHTDRLKTLEEDNALQKKMIKFIMKNGKVYEDNGEVFSLQDLWDEDDKCDDGITLGCKCEPIVEQVRAFIESIKKQMGDFYPDEAKIGEPPVNKGFIEPEKKDSDYECGNNMLKNGEQRCYIRPTDNSEKIEHDPKVETYNCPACIKDQKIEEIIRQLHEDLPAKYMYTLTTIESWLRDKLRNI